MAWAASSCAWARQTQRSAGLDWLVAAWRRSLASAARSAAVFLEYSALNRSLTAFSASLIWAASGTGSRFSCGVAARPRTRTAASAMGMISLPDYPTRKSLRCTRVTFHRNRGSCSCDAASDPVCGSDFRPVGHPDRSLDGPSYRLPPRAYGRGRLGDHRADLPFQRHLAAGDQYRDDRRDLPDGLPHPEHPEPGKPRASAQAG